MAYKKHLFLIVYNKDNEVLAIKKSYYSGWELPSVVVPLNKAIRDVVQDYFSKELKLLNYNFQGSSSIINKYELPKEFASIAGFSGEEQKFEYISTNVDIQTSNKIIDKRWMNIHNLVSELKIKNFSSFKEALANEFRAIVNKHLEEKINEKKEDNSKEILKDFDIENLF
jgi:hypothetical protein